MMALRRLILTAILLMVFPTPSFAGLDTQLWLKGTVKWKLDTCKIAHFSLDSRWEDGISKTYHNHAEIGLGYHWFTHLTVTTSYRVVARKNTGTHSPSWQIDQQPILDFDHRFPLHSITLGVRQRFQWRTRESQVNYRLRVSLEFWECALGSVHLKPILSQEVIYALSHRFRSDRFYVGALLSTHKRGALEAGVMLNHRGHFWSKNGAFVFMLSWITELGN